MQITGLLEGIGDSSGNVCCATVRNPLSFIGTLRSVMEFREEAVDSSLNLPRKIH